MNGRERKRQREKEREKEGKGRAGEECPDGRRQDQRRKESSNSLDPLSRANINELKRVLSRPCHSSGRQNHPVDYEIMLLQKNKEWRRKRKRQLEEEGKEGMASPPLGIIVREYREEGGRERENHNACET